MIVLMNEDVNVVGCRLVDTWVAVTLSVVVIGEVTVAVEMLRDVLVLTIVEPDSVIVTGTLTVTIVGVVNVTKLVSVTDETVVAVDILSDVVVLTIVDPDSVIVVGTCTVTIVGVVIVTKRVSVTLTVEAGCVVVTS